MPSTLVHIGVQAPLTRAGLRGPDLKWVLAGCLLPDLPWIGRRMASAVDPSLDPYHLMAYAHVQASLASCLILATALALLSRRPGRTWIVLAFGATAHLLLDSLEVKPGNGVHLMAPVDWWRLSLDLVWPDGAVTLVLSAVSTAYCIWAWLRIDPEPPPTRWPGGGRLVAAAGLGGLWLLAPVAFTTGPIGADTMSLATLMKRDERPGRLVTCDRCPLRHDDGAAYALTYAREELRLIGADLSGIEEASFRGRFVDVGTVEVELLRPHTPGVRDFASLAGIAFVVLWWAREAVGMWRTIRSGLSGASSRTSD
jgi:hypothetical protein